MINIEPRVSHEVELRLQQLLPQIRLEERTRLSTGENAILPVFTATDEEFESYVEQLIVGEKVNHLNVVLEKLRDRAALCWKRISNEQGQITAEQIAHIKETEFLPAIRRLVLLGLLLIKFSAPVQWFSLVIDLLTEVFDASHKAAPGAGPTTESKCRRIVGRASELYSARVGSFVGGLPAGLLCFSYGGKHQYLSVISSHSKRRSWAR